MSDVIFEDTDVVFEDSDVIWDKVAAALDVSDDRTYQVPLEGRIYARIIAQNRYYVI
jgi:hypothetical protein